MKTRFHRWLYVLIVASWIGACSPGAAPDSPAEPMTADASLSGSPGITAEATSAVTVLLSWEPQPGAMGYRLEADFGDGEFFTLAELDAAQSSFEHFPAPSGAELSYRLVPLSANGESQALNAHATTPEVQPNPLTVQATLEQADFDLSSIDFSNLTVGEDAAGGLDLSQLLPQPVSTSQVIGVEGGSLSVTGSNGVVYTLEVPPGALLGDNILTLTPVQSIDGLPFSGSLIGAVSIQPEGIEFEVPARLIIEVPEELQQQSAQGGDLVEMGFAYEREGEEFHLRPLVDGGEPEQASEDGGTAKLARLMSPQQKVRSKVIIVDRARSYGSRTLTRPEGKDQAIRRPPTKKADQVNQETAARRAMDHDDELAPLVPVPARVMERFHALKGNFMAAASSGCRDFKLAVDGYRAWVHSMDAQLTTDNQRLELANAFVDAARQLLESSLKVCFSAEEDCYQWLADTLINPPSDPFLQKVSEIFKQRHPDSDPLMIDILAMNKKCKVALKIDSTISITVADSTTSATVGGHIDLHWQYDANEQRAYLYGVTPLLYAGQPTVSGCLITINALDRSVFNVLRLEPQYDNVSGALTGFVMPRYSIAGMQSGISGECEGTPGGGHSLAGTGDIWGGLYATIHMGNWTVKDWKILGGHEEGSPNPMVAEKVVDGSVAPAMGGSGHEKTTFLLYRVNQN